MQGFLIERLYPTGWRRDGEIWWRFCDATVECDRSLREELILGVRVLAVQVHPQAAMEIFAGREEVLT